MLLRRNKGECDKKISRGQGALPIGTDICSSVIAPALLYYTPSMALCNICIHHIPVDYAGGRAPKVGALGDAGAVAEERKLCLQGCR